MFITRFCYWHTRKSPGAEYYTGIERVDLNMLDDATPEEIEHDAIERAQAQVWHRAFQDHSKSHIIVWDVRTHK